MLGLAVLVIAEFLRVYLIMPFPGSQRVDSIAIAYALHRLIWPLTLHPNSLVLQPDPLFADEYASLRGFDDGTRGGALTGRDPASWKEKSWVIGVVADGARAYDWNQLVHE